MRRVSSAVPAPQDMPCNAEQAQIPRIHLFMRQTTAYSPKKITGLALCSKTTGQNVTTTMN